MSDYNLTQTVDVAIQRAEEAIEAYKINPSNENKSALAQADHGLYLAKTKGVDITETRKAIDALLD
jgi:hypothetical protein